MCVLKKNQLFKKRGHVFENKDCGGVGGKEWKGGTNAIISQNIKNYH